MQTTIKRVTDENLHADFQIRQNFSFSSDIEHVRTTDENLNKLSIKRAEQLISSSSRDDLTRQEIIDVTRYQSGDEKPKRFKNIKEFLADLND